MAPRKLLGLVSFFAMAGNTVAFHDCVQPRSRKYHPNPRLATVETKDTCYGGLCVGMHNGPHEGGPAAYPVGNDTNGYTSVYSTMIVPETPEKLDGICFYIWTDIFFGDVGFGRMNQIVPQLVLGNALSGSSGPPDYLPRWSEHRTWAFGAHYFFEIFNSTTGNVDGHAAYGPMLPVDAGETLYTSFKRKAEGAWEIEMGVVGNSSRVSTLLVDQPYMGMGVNWPEPATSWDQRNFSNVCINACWELYGANDRAHLPHSGSHYNITIGQERQQYPWVEKWDEDEGSDKPCPASQISEWHNSTMQRVEWDISVNGA